MKDDKEHIDKLFESLNDRQFDIPEAFLEDLNKRLDSEPKRRRYGFLWFLLPLVLIGAIGISYFYYSDNSEVKSSANKLIAKDEYKDLNSHPDSYRDQNAYHLSEPNQNNHYSIDSNSAQGQPGKKQINTPENTELQTKPAHSIQLSPKTVQTKDAQIKQAARFKTINRRSGSEIRTGKQTKWTKSVKMAEALSGKDEKPKEAEDKMIQASIPDAVDQTSANTKPGKEESSKESIPEKETDSAIAQNTTDSIQQSDSSCIEEEARLSKDEITSKPPVNNWKKEVQLFAGLGGNGIHDTPKNSDYLAKIKENQHSILAPSFGVNANLSYKQFTFGSGVNYAQTGEKFKVDIKSTELKDSTYSEFVQDTVWVQDSIGNWIPTIHDTTIYHTVQYMDSAWVSQSFQNRYSWISIPLHFGYRFELGDYELIPRLGAVFNFGITQGMGRYPNTSFNNTNRYKPVKFNVSYLIELEARRNFDKWFVFINPYFRSMINPGVSGDVIRRRYSSWGIQFGVGLKL